MCKYRPGYHDDATDICICGGPKQRLLKHCINCTYKFRSGENHPAYKGDHAIKRQLEYTSYRCMLARCGYIGPCIHDGYELITVCDRWLDSENGFKNFVEDMGPKPGRRYDIDRRERTGDYNKDNCQWLERCEHARKTRREAVQCESV